MVTGAQRGSRQRVHAGVALGLSTAIALLAPSATAAETPGLDVYWIDVEGGAATLIVTPARESLLIDAGNPGTRDAERIVKVAREQAGLSRIDHLVVTHFHLDHFGGVPEVARALPIGTLYDYGVDSAPEKERTDPRLTPYRETPAGKRVRITPGLRIRLKPKKGTAAASFTFLGARQDFGKARGRKNKTICATATPGEEDTSDNKNSAVMLLGFGPFRLFDGGDLTWNAELGLVCPLDRVGPVDVFQVNHHGLDNSNHPALAATLDPHVAVFNNGPRKGCGPKTFATVKALPAIEAVYQVHRNTAHPEANAADDHIANVGDGKECTAHFVKLSVGATGTSYTVSIPSRGHTRTFKTRTR
jgi:beta-lactamase superfamily II metal-dependent hydrolase